MVDFGVLRTLPCALLLAEILTLLISFVAMATQESFSNSSSMQYLLAMGIITFVVCLALLVGALRRRGLCARALSRAPRRAPARARALTCPLARPRWHARSCKGGYMMGLFSITAFAEACVYLFFAVMIFIGFLAGAVACNRSGSPCKTSGTSAHANVSIAFAFFATLGACVLAQPVGAPAVPTDRRAAGIARASPGDALCLCVWKVNLAANTRCLLPLRAISPRSSIRILAIPARAFAANSAHGRRRLSLGSPTELLVSAWVAYGAHQVGGGMGTQAEGGGYVGGYA